MQLPLIIQPPLFISFAHNALLTGNLKGHVFAAFLAKQVPL